MPCALAPIRSLDPQRFPRTHPLFRRSTAMTTPSNQESLTDRELVVACLSATKATITIPSGVDQHARLLCDGMGKLCEPDLDRRTATRCYDWSHVRDSSDKAAKCAAYLRRYLRLADLVSVANAARERGDPVAYEGRVGGVEGCVMVVPTSG